MLQPQFSYQTRIVWWLTWGKNVIKIGQKLLKLLSKNLKCWQKDGITEFRTCWKQYTPLKLVCGEYNKETNKQQQSDSGIHDTFTRGEYRLAKPYRDILRYGDSVLRYAVNTYWIASKVIEMDFWGTFILVQ